ncbi:MAG: tyrosine-type recombinase/integrase [Ignavibacteriaceae bacterium]
MSKKQKYCFNKAIENKLQGFKTWLEGQRNEQSTIRQKLNYTGYFLRWMEGEGLTEPGTAYNDLLVFIDHCRTEGKSKKHINTMLRSIRNYYDYLKSTGEVTLNPAANLYLKGVRHKLPHDILSSESLSQLYQSYPVIDNRSKRNKIILGMLIYQGITTDELMRLTTTDVKLQGGKVHIPGSKHSNSRTLELKSFQVMELHEYINRIRPGLIVKPTDQIFISMEGSVNMKNSLHHLFRALKRTNPGIKNAKQIRASVITAWLKTYNLRQVQYMAGHRYVSSTERYQLNNLEGLKDQVDKYHPLG